MCHPSWLRSSGRRNRRSGLAFASDRSGNGDIYVMNFLSDDEQQLTEGLAIDGSPRWSP
jgi:Tol biopolymer transport system component